MRETDVGRAARIGVRAQLPTGPGPIEVELVPRDVARCVASVDAVRVLSAGACDVLVMGRDGDRSFPIDLVTVIGVAAPQAPAPLASPSESGAPSHVIEGALRGIADDWGSLGGGAGVRWRVALPESVWAPEATIGWSYLASSHAAAAPLAGTLTLFRHDVELSVGASIRLATGSIEWVARGALGAATVLATSELEAAARTDTGVGLILAAGLGPSVRAGGVAWGLCAGVRRGIELTGTSWDEPLGRWFLEVTGALV